MSYLTKAKRSVSRGIGDINIDIAGKWKNVNKSAEERKMYNVRTVSIDTSSGSDVKPTVSRPSGKICKIVMDCRNANQLIKEIKSILTDTEATYDAVVNREIDAIKTRVSALTTKNIMQFAASMTDYEDTLKGIIKGADEVRYQARRNDLPPKRPIKIRVFLENIEQEGDITQINVTRKTVAVRYKNEKGIEESLVNIDINKLCIEGKDCMIEIGEVPMKAPGGPQEGGQHETTDQTWPTETGTGTGTMNGIYICD